MLEEIGVAMADGVGERRVGGGLGSGRSRAW